MEKLSPAEKALLMFWRSYVPIYDPNKNQYRPDVHTVAHRTMLYYFMTEDLIEFFRQHNVPGCTGRALFFMHVSSGTLAEWRQKWGAEWRKMQKIQP